MTATRYTVIALLAGIAYVFITPPFAVPDEQNQFWRSFAVAHGQVVAKHGLDETPIARSVQNFAWIIGRTEPHETLREKLRLVAALPYDSRRGAMVRFAAWYTPLPYVAQAGIALLPLRPMMLFYAGRLTNLLVAVALIGLAMRAAPKHANVIAAAALLPMTLYELASWSADAATIALAWLFTALLLEPPRRTWVAVLAGLAVGLCKPAYFLIALLALVTKFRWRERAAIVGATAFGTMLSLVAAHRGAYNARAGLPVDAAAQIRCIIADSAHFFGVIARDVTSNGRFYIEEMIGRFGANELKLPPLVITIELLLLAIVALTSGAAVAPRVRAAAVAIAAATVTGILLSQYLIWSIVCGDALEGVQGRYFLEILPLVLAAIALPRVRWRPAHWAIIAGAVVCNAIALQTLVHRYW